MTIQETDVHLLSRANKELSRWSELLENNKNLELGADPNLIVHIESDLDDLLQSIRQQLGPQFDLCHVSLSKANTYFATTRHLDETVELIRTIREEAYGSRQNTMQCLDSLEQCKKSMVQMGGSLLM